VDKEQILMIEQEYLPMMLYLTECQNFIIYHLTLVKNTKPLAADMAVAVAEAAEAAEALVMTDEEECRKDNAS
jgi:hypothetical protein